MGVWFSTSCSGRGAFTGARPSVAPPTNLRFPSCNFSSAFEPEITGVVIQKIAKCVVSQSFLYLGAIAISFSLITMQQLNVPPMEH